MKKQKAPVGRILKIGLIYLTFALTVYVMVRSFIVIKAYSWYHTVVNYATMDRESGYFYQEYAEERFHTGRALNTLEFRDVFYDYDDLEWIEENYGGFPGYDEKGLGEVKSRGELYRGIFEDRNGCYTWQVMDYPLAITATKSKNLINIIRWAVCFFLFILVVASRALYSGREHIREKMNTNILLSGLSHDLTGHIGRLKEYVTTWKTAGIAERSACSEAVIREVDILDEVIRKQMKVKDIANGTIDLHPEEIDLYYMTQKLVEKIKPTLGNKKLQITVDSPEPENCIVVADPDIMKLLIGNMIRLASEETETEIVLLLTPENGGKLIFNMIVMDYWVTADEARRIWYTERLYDLVRVKDFGSEGCSWAAVGQMLRIQHFPYTCTTLDKGTEFWFRIKRVRTEE